MREEVEKRLVLFFFHIFPIFCGSGGSKSRLAKTAGAVQGDNYMQNMSLSTVHFLACGKKEKREATTLWLNSLLTDVQDVT